ncbi:MAG: flavin reductase family protein [Phycisphaeraceae bacterium]
MLLDFAAITAEQAYFVMIQAIVPRPIAWVLSDNGDGSHNLAPFSFFTGVSSRPPILLISVGRKPDGTRKDTWVNIEERGEFVVHIAPRELAAPLVATSATLAHGESEVSATGLSTEPIEGFRLPRVVGPKLAMWCSRHEIIEVGDGPQGLILGRVQAMYVDDGIVERQGGRIVINPKGLNPLARLGGSEYAALGEVFSMARPK